MRLQFLLNEIYEMVLLIGGQFVIKNLLIAQYLIIYYVIDKKII